MSSAAIGLIGIAGLVAIMLAGMPVSFCMILVGFAGYGFISGFDKAFYNLGSIPYSMLADFNFVMLPLFLLMSAVAVQAGISRDLYKTGNSWFGHIRGGLAMASVIGCGGFAAISSDSVASAAAMGKAVFPEMEKYGYDRRLSTGCLAAGGTIGVLIPPSVGFVFYGILTRQSIGQLFMAGILPGIFQVVTYIVLIYLLCLSNPQMGPAGAKTSFKQKIFSLKETWSVIVLFILVTGGIYGGFFTPSEAAAVGALGAFLIGFSMRRLKRKGIISAFLETGRITAMVGLLLVGAMMFSRFMAISKMPFLLADFVSGLEMNRYIVLIVILAFYIAAGCFMDVVSMIVLTLPIIFPLITALDFNAIWYGVLMVKMMELGTISPPFGVTCFVLSSVTGVPLGTIFRGIFPFMVSDLVQIAILIAVPAISLWIPSTMRA